MKQPRHLLLPIESNRVTCGNCRFLHTVVTGGIEDEWGCDLFGSKAHLGLKSHMRTPNRPKVCTDAEDAVDNYWAGDQDPEIRELTAKATQGDEKAALKLLKKLAKKPRSTR